MSQFWRKFGENFAKYKSSLLAKDEIYSFLFHFFTNGKKIMTNSKYFNAICQVK